MSNVISPIICVEPLIEVKPIEVLWGKANEWVCYDDPEKEALRKELEDAKRELAAAKEQLSQLPAPRKFKVSHEVVFTPKMD